MLGSLLLTGLSAGLFCAWSISVIPGTLKINDMTYLTTMQSINRAILNPLFFMVFFGSPILLAISTIAHYGGQQQLFVLLISALLVYLIGTIGVTGLGNVPLNDQLEALVLDEQRSDQLATFRRHYEDKWNRLHQIRTICTLIAFGLIAMAVLKYSKEGV